MYSIYPATANRNPQLLVVLINAHRAVCLPHAALRRRPHLALSRDVVHPQPRPLRLVTPCLIPTPCVPCPDVPCCRVATDTAVPHQEVVAAVGTGAATTLDLSS
jgi:hypothetical protein